MSDSERPQLPEIPPSIDDIPSLGDLPRPASALALLVAEEVNDPNPYLNFNAMRAVIDAIRAGNFVVDIGNTNVIVNEKLGGGGTKDVYRVSIKDSDFALALPNKVDGAQRALEKWSKVVHEPKNTEKIRAIGLKANPLSKLVKAKINGIEFPLIAMLPYDQLPFVVHDSKNPFRKGRFLESEELNDEIFEKLFQNVIHSIQVLIRNGVRLGRDSFNLCFDEHGDLDLYLNDFNYLEFNNITEDQWKDVAEAYVSRAIDAFLNTLTHEEFYGVHKEYCSKLGDLDSEILKKLTVKVVEGLSASKDA